MGDEEGVIVADFLLDTARKTKKRPRCFGKMWAFPMPWFAYIWPETQHMGEQSMRKIRGDESVRLKA
jgi:hypothetical protein